MSNGILLYGKPRNQGPARPELTVTGELSPYILEAAYESRLSINNPVGRCSVEVTESNLPRGYSVRVDNITKQVVVKWPAFSEVVDETSVVPNGDFENGDDGSWVPGGGNGGVGWSIGSGPGYDVYSGTHSARFADANTRGSDLICSSVEAKVNDYIRASAKVQQGASSSGNAGARLSMVYRDENGKELLLLRGNLVTSGKNGQWKDSSTEGAAPAGTKSVQVILSAYRNKQNHPLWVDLVRWDHKYAVGQHTNETYSLSLRVTDSENREALWSGQIKLRVTSYRSELLDLAPYHLFNMDEAPGITALQNYGSAPAGWGTLGISPTAQRQLASSVPSMPGAPSLGNIVTNGTLATGPGTAFLDRWPVWTVVCSVTLSNRASTGVLWHFGNAQVSGGQGFSLQYTPTGVVGVEWFSGGWQWLPSSAGKIVVGVPVQLTVSRSGNSLNIYVNDTLVATRAMPPTTVLSTQGVTIGNKGGAPGNALFGRMQFLTIYDRALSGSQIASLAHEGGFV